MTNTTITDSDIRGLLTDAGQSSDGVQIALCHIALGDDERTPAWAREELMASRFADASQELAWHECERVIRARRAEVAS